MLGENIELIALNKSEWKLDKHSGIIVKISWYLLGTHDKSDLVYKSLACRQQDIANCPN